MLKTHNFYFNQWSYQQAIKTTVFVNSISPKFYLKKSKVEYVQMIISKLINMRAS